MKIKTLAIALLATTTIITSPLTAKDKIKPVTAAKEMDKASPANLSIQTSADKMEVAKKKAQTELLSKELDKATPKTSTAIPPSITALEVTAPNQATDLSSETEIIESKSVKGYVKIDDIKGESTRAADTISPDRIEFKKAIAVPDIDSDSDEDDKPATDYNSSRSNKADGIAAPDPDNDDSDDSDDETDTKATDYNSSRSNKNSNH